MSMDMAATSPIWGPQSPILAAVQTARIFNDSKDFVDAPLAVSPAVALERFRALPGGASDPNYTASLKYFVDQTFGPPGGWLDAWRPPDHHSDPNLLNRIPAGPLRDWARALNDMWPQLGRRMSAEALAHPERTTLLPCVHGFVVPGGRFREAYYWDTYWVVLGLLSVGMTQTAEGIVQNFLAAVHKYGFVPNGLRTYYLNRSQPPLLAQMVAALVDATPLPQDARRLLREALPALDREYDWWMRTGANGSSVELPQRSGSVSASASASSRERLNRYVVDAPYPRPESWREDAATAADLPEDARRACYCDLAAGAESGWDFSTRWLSPQAQGELSSIRTSSIVPVELNAILYRNELTLQRLHARLAELPAERGTAPTKRRRADDDSEDTAVTLAAGGASTADCDEDERDEETMANAHAASAERYAAAAKARLRAMSEWMWDSASRRWHDVDLKSGHRLRQESAASYMPLWAGAYESVEQATLAADALGASALVQPGGVATTLIDSGQQWDWPNAWPPLQQMLIEGLASCGASSAASLASTLAARWLRSNLMGWAATGHMHEKYDATRPGERGGGGEYTPQVGFGWTNGVVLWLLDQGYRPAL